MGFSCFLPGACPAAVGEQTLCEGEVMNINRLLSSFVLIVLSVGAAHASVFGDVKGTVLDPQQHPLVAAKVGLLSRTSSFSRTTVTDSDGAFSFRALPIGEYTVTVESNGFSKSTLALIVLSDRTTALSVQLKIAPVTQQVEIRTTPGQVDSGSPTPVTLVSRKQIEQTPGASRTNSLAMITDYVPGSYVTHNQLHIRGGHQVTWLVDGVPVANTNIADTVGPQFDPKDIDYLEVQRGSYSAEYGDRTYGVFNAVPRSGFERSRQAELVTSYGNLNSTDNQLSFGDHNDRSAYYFSVNGNRTDHGLETPTPDNLHNQAAGGGAFTSLIFNATPKDQLRFVGSGRTDFYQVPNDADLQAAGVRDREREQDIFGSLSWIHTFGPGVLLTLSPSYHFNRAAFEGLGAADQRLVTTDNRASSYAGGQASVNVVKGRHNASIGFYSFAQHDNTLFGLAGTSFDASTDPPTAIPVNVPLTRQKVSGDLEAVWIQDQYKASSWLSLTAGVRFTRFAGLVTETAGSPRLGIAIQVPRLHWVLRGSYSRYYQAPPLDTVSSDVLTAVAPDQGFLPLRGERDEQHDIGLTIPVRGWTLDFDHFRTGAHNFFDHDALGNSNLFIALTIQSVRIFGYEATMRSPKLFKKLDLHLAYSHQSVEGSGGVTGGLTDFAPPDAGFFFLDHDQRHTLSTGFTALLPARSWLSGNVSAGSGFLDGNGPGHLPSYATVDLAVGHSFGENWSAKLTTTNLADKRYFIDRTNSFGGSHVSDPRMVSVQLRYRFHY